MLFPDWHKYKLSEIVSSSQTFCAKNLQEMEELRINLHEQLIDLLQFLKENRNWTEEAYKNSILHKILFLSQLKCKYSSFSSWYSHPVNKLFISSLTLASCNNQDLKTTINRQSGELIFSEYSKTLKLSFGTWLLHCQALSISQSLNWSLSLRDRDRADTISTIGVAAIGTMGTKAPPPD